MTIAVKLVTIDSNVEAAHSMIAAMGGTPGAGSAALEEAIATIPQEEGLDTSDATAVAGDLLLNKTAYADGAKITGTIATYSGDTTITPGANQTTLQVGSKYCNSNIVVSGDADLVGGNIKKDVNIFGVVGTYEGSGGGGGDGLPETIEVDIDYEVLRTEADQYADVLGDYAIYQQYYPIYDNQTETLDNNLCAVYYNEDIETYAYFIIDYYYGSAGPITQSGWYGFTLKFSKTLYTDSTWESGSYIPNRNAGGDSGYIMEPYTGQLTIGGSAFTLGYWQWEDPLEGVLSWLDVAGTYNRFNPTAVGPNPHDGSMTEYPYPYPQWLREDGHRKFSLFPYALDWNRHPLRGLCFRSNTNNYYLDTFHTENILLAPLPIFDIVSSDDGFVVGDVTTSTVDSSNTTMYQRFNGYISAVDAGVVTEVLSIWDYATGPSAAVFNGASGGGTIGLTKAGKSVVLSVRPYASTFDWSPLTYIMRYNQFILKVSLTFEVS